MSFLRSVTEDLLAEGDAVETLVANLSEESWSISTPSVGWTIAHQIGHLAWTDEISLLSVAGQEGFERMAAEKASQAATMVDDGAAEYAARRKPELLATWQRGRRQLAERLAAAPERTKLAWFGPPMNPVSMATARIMESWAHGLDIADALGVDWPATHRLKHVAHIGVRARGYAFLVNGLTPPTDEIRVELSAPEGIDPSGGSVWAWGAEDAEQRVTATALDFCYLVCQRRPRGWLNVTAEGADAERWLAVAQAFAGLPGSRRAELEHARA